MESLDGLWIADFLLNGQPHVIAAPWVLFASTVAIFFFSEHEWAPYLNIVLQGGYVIFGEVLLVTAHAGSRH